MDRRSFLTGLVGVAGAAAVAAIARPTGASAGVPNTGILDELNAPAEEFLEQEEASPVQYRRDWRGEPWGGRGHGPRYGPRYGRRYGRRGGWRWRRVCRRYWYRGRVRYRCYRRRVWVGW